MLHAAKPLRLPQSFLPQIKSDNSDLTNLDVALYHHIYIYVYYIVQYSTYS